MVNLASVVRSIFTINKKWYRLKTSTMSFMEVGHERNQENLVSVLSSNHFLLVGRRTPIMLS